MWRNTMTLFDKRWFMWLMLGLVIFGIIYVMITVNYFLYVIDLLTAEKPCIGIGNYCTYYDNGIKCEKGADYVICDTP